MDVELIKQELLTKDSEQFYQQHLLGNEVWFYKKYLRDTDYSGTYDKLKRYISDELDIHFNNVAIFGSAKIGFSLNPDKNLREFCKDSDIDIVLVSNDLFHLFWNAYLEMYRELRFINKYSIVASSIFRQFISFYGFDNYCQEYIDWLKKTESFKKDLQLLYKFGTHNISYRIFNSWEAVKRYYVRNINDLKRKIEKNGGTDYVDKND